MLLASLRSACAASRRSLALLRAPAAAFSSAARPADLPVHNEHRSNAEAMVNALPVILVQSTTALCDGGGGATGHPVEYMKLDKREGASPSVCKYCGLRFKMAPGAREWWGEGSVRCGRGGRRAAQGREGGHHPPHSHARPLRRALLSRLLPPTQPPTPKLMHDLCDVAADHH